MIKSTRILPLSLLLALSLFCLSFKAPEASFDPEAIWLTWQRRADTTMTVHWLAPIGRPDRPLIYQKVGESTWSSVIGERAQLPAPRKHTVLVSVELTNLEPDTVYAFRPGDDGRTFQFRTLPSTLKKSVRFAAGGDMYRDSLKDFERTCRAVAKTNPAFVLAGGDLAYVYPSREDCPSCVERWIEFLAAWKRTMITPNGHLIPILPIIGNHEVDTTGDSLFSMLFAMPGIQGYNILDAGDYLSIALLDSGYVHSVEGAQSSWLYNALQDRQHIANIFAVYHAPAYPSVRPYEDSPSKEIRQTWVPIFEKFGLAAAFENHDHAYKRTHLILGGRADPNGVLYLGDGCWGVTPRQPAKNRWYLAKSKAIQHFIVVTLTPSYRHYQAVNAAGVVFDEYRQQVATIPAGLSH